MNGIRLPFTSHHHLPLVHHPQEFRRFSHPNFTKKHPHLLLEVFKRNYL
jgi:hypothetical protein